MWTISSEARRLVALAACLGVTLAAPRPGSAQVVEAGAARVQLSDITVNVPAMVLFGVGTIKTFSCPIAWGVRSTADNAAAALDAGRFDVATAAGVRKRPSPVTQRNVLDVFSAGPQARRAAGTVATALEKGPGQGGPARALLHDLEGLLSESRLMDPTEPGYRAPTGLAVAVGSFNEYVDASSDAFLADPPDDFLVIQKVLSDLIVAALQNEGREVDAASLRGEFGLVCAPPPPPAPVTPVVPSPVPAPPPPEKPLERAIELCVLADGGIRYVPAIVVPSTADTLAIRRGDRMPFAAAFPNVGYAGDSLWFKGREAIEVGAARYEPFGQPFLPRRSDVYTQFAEYRGVPLLVKEGTGRDPGVIFVPSAPRCTLQPYEKPTRVRKGG